MPVVSWVALRGRCRQCKAEIGIEPLVLELSTAAVFVVVRVEFGDDAALPAFCILAATLVVQSWIDLQDAAPAARDHHVGWGPRRQSP